MQVSLFFLGSGAVAAEATGLRPVTWLITNLQNFGLNIPYTKEIVGRIKILISHSPVKAPIPVRTHCTNA